MFKDKLHIGAGWVRASRANLTRLVAVIMLVQLGWAAEFPKVAESPVEMRKLQEWTTAKFGGDRPVSSPQLGLVVVTNFDELCLNTRMGQPLAIGKTEYSRGLFCHANSRLLVRLPAPGKAFSAFVGVDSNNQTRGGRGSIVFSVSVAGKEAFRSKIMREDTPAERLSIELGGATEFLLEAGDAGDGIACDQADWVDAKILLADGHVLWLGELPILEGQAMPATSTDLPFSFSYGGQLSAALLPQWELNRRAQKLDDQRTKRTMTWADPKTKLVLRWEAIEYHDFPTVEWTLYFKNNGAMDTPIIADLQALDTRFERKQDEVYARFAAPGEFVLNHNVGSPCAANDYQPLRTSLAHKTAKRIATSGGRGSNSDWPYFNIEWPGEGVIAVVGWPGQWAASFTRDEANGLRVRAGQEQTHFKLLPGEEVRTPLIVLQFWQGDRIRSQNTFRRWMLAHNVPQPGGQPISPMLFGCSSHFTSEMVDANETNQLQFINRYLEERLKIDYWWMDAGWYFCDGNWTKTGTWEVDTKRFPRGLRAISDHAHSKGIKTIVWFEPERVAPGTWLTEQHAEWILGGKKGGLLNLGNSVAREWLTEHVSKLITAQGIDLYRQDFNMDPLDSWRQNDAPDRQGITENHHITGYLAYWDELLRRHPGLLIDSCASGGRRNDLETMRRSVPLWRTDFRLDPVGTQCHSYGISFWLPLSGTGTGSYAAYDFRSNMSPLLNCIWDVRIKDADYELMRRLCEQFRQVADCYLGDFYPLTPYSLENTSWLGWQFDRPDLGSGMVQVFRRSESIYKAADLRLSGLDPEARYRVRNLDSPDADILTGRQLMSAGVAIVLNDRPSAAVIRYEKIGE
ncbi:MAG: alpha-galactosidase [Verrucomicrobiota bacterium]